MPPFARPSFRNLRYFMPQTLVEGNWNGGICRDLPRSSIPEGYMYDCVDFMLERPGMAYKRGGFSKFGNTAGATTTAGSFISAPSLNGTPYVFFKAADGNLYKYTSTIAIPTSLGACSITPIDYPKVYPGASDILIIPAGDGTTAPKKVYIGSPSIGDLGGSPPAGKYLAIHQNRAVLGGTAANPNRIYFGPAPNVEATWDTTNSFIDVTYPITSLVSVQGVLLAFSNTFCERIVGDIPPGNEGANMILQPLGATGCSSPLSIQPWGNYVIFGNAKGVWVTNGAGFDSLTDKTNGTGITTLWNSSLSGQYTSLTSALLNQKYYVVTAPNQVAKTLICYLPTKSWWRLSGVNMYFSATNADFTGLEDVFFHGNYGGRGNMVLQMGSMLTPDSTNTADIAALQFLPSMTTRMIGDGTGLKAYEHGHVTYTANSAFSGNVGDTVMSVQYSKGLRGEDSFVAVPESPLGLTGTTNPLVQRKRVIYNFDAQSMQVKLTMTSSPDSLEIYAIESEIRATLYGTTAEAVYT